MKTLWEFDNVDNKFQGCSFFIRGKAQKSIRLSNPWPKTPEDSANKIGVF